MDLLIFDPSLPWSEFVLIDPLSRKPFYSFFFPEDKCLIQSKSSLSIDWPHYGRHWWKLLKFSLLRVDKTIWDLCAQIKTSSVLLNYLSIINWQTTKVTDNERKIDISYSANCKLIDKQMTKFIKFQHLTEKFNNIITCRPIVTLSMMLFCKIEWIINVVK